MNARQMKKNLKKQIDKLQSDNDLMHKIISDSPSMQETYDRWKQPLNVVHSSMRFEKFVAKRVVNNDYRMEYSKLLAARDLLDRIKDEITYKVDPFEHIQVKAEVHGGFTFLGMLWNAEEYGLDGIWLGWDYAHLFDYIWTGIENQYLRKNSKKWTTEEIRQEALGVLKAIKEGEYKMRGPIHFVFISTPMSGKTDKEIGHRLCSINGAVKKACVAKFGWNWDDIMTIDNFWDRDEPSYNSGMKVKNTSVFYLGGALQKLSRADAVYFDEGWEHANGCQVERFVALKYEIPVLFYNVQYGGVVNGEKEG